MKTTLKPAVKRRRLSMLLTALLTVCPALVYPERPLPPGGNFTLQGPSGKVSLGDFRGRIVVMYFGYLTCADICPTSMSLIAGALRQLSPSERKRIAGIFITVDPERDNAQTAANYASQFDSSFTGLSGDLPVIREVAARYGAQFKKVPVRSAMGYAVDHSSATYIVDPGGRLVRVLGHGSGTRDILEALRAELRK